MEKDCFNNPEIHNFKGKDRTKKGKGNNSNGRERVRCYNCDQYGHIAVNCPKKEGNNTEQKNKTETTMFCGFVHEAHRVSKTSQEK